VSRDEDYELWLAMQDETPVVEVPVVETPVVEEVNLVPAAFAEILEDAVQEEPNTEFEQISDPELGLPNTLFKEPQTNSIVIQPTDPLLAGSIITESGEVVLTGSIELPVVPTTTGGIAIVQLPDVNAADGIMAEDFAGSYVASVAPIRASGVMNSRARESVLPIKNRRGEGQMVMLSVASLLMVTVGALVIAAFWLGVL